MPERLSEKRGYTAGEPPPIGVERNCWHCGKDYLDCSESGNTRICPLCRKPKHPNLYQRRRPGHLPKSPIQPLSLREKQVTDAVASGKLNKEVAYLLHLTEGTIKTYLSKIFDKTGTTNRTELAVWWVLEKAVRGAEAGGP